MGQNHNSFEGNSFVLQRIKVVMTEPNDSNMVFQADHVLNCFESQMRLLRVVEPGILKWVLDDQGPIPSGGLWCEIYPISHHTGVHRLVGFHGVALNVYQALHDAVLEHGVLVGLQVVALVEEILTNLELVVLDLVLVVQDTTENDESQL